MTRPARVRLRGQALTEYLVVALAVAAALFAPVNGAPLAAHLLEAVARAWRNYAFLVAQS